MDIVIDLDNGMKIVLSRTGDQITTKLWGEDENGHEMLIALAIDNQASFADAARILVGM